MGAIYMENHGKGRSVMDLNVLLFENFTALDVFGPVEVLSKVRDYRLRYVSMDGGVVTNEQNIRIETEKITPEHRGDIWLLPGGMGTRPLVKDREFLGTLREIAGASAWFLTVCTGSAVLAASGALDGVRATGNKRAFDWTMSCGEKVLWEREPRWVSDGKFYTSAGVSAGIDMALAFVADRFGSEKAESIAAMMEYFPSENLAPGLRA